MAAVERILDTTDVCRIFVAVLSHVIVQPMNVNSIEAQLFSY